jgi:hypothetical protein
VLVHPPSSKFSPGCLCFTQYQPPFPVLDCLSIWFVEHLVILRYICGYSSVGTEIAAGYQKERNLFLPLCRYRFSFPLITTASSLPSLRLLISRTSDAKQLIWFVRAHVASSRPREEIPYHPAKQLEEVSVEKWSALEGMLQVERLGTASHTHR